MQNIKEILAAEVTVVDQAIEQDIAGLTAEIDPLLKEVLQYGLLNGGKRIRPLLVLLASRFCGRDDNDLAMLAAAFEYLHVATLLHDDVIDNADKRRGKPSVYAQYGLTPAILTGDFLLARCMTIVGELSGQQGLNAFCKATRAMVDGEFVQLRNSEDYGLSVDKYFEAIQGKTAQLLSAACEVGAVYGGGDQQARESFIVYGSNLGAAFQIIDDLLDYLGDTGKTGKAVGNDLVEGKVTLPLIYALQNAADKDKNELLGLLENEERRRDSFERVVALVERNNGFSQSQEKATQLMSDAVAHIERLHCRDQNAKNILLGLAQYILVRKK